MAAEEASSLEMVQGLERDDRCVCVCVCVCVCAYVCAYVHVHMCVIIILLYVIMSAYDFSVGLH